MAEFIEVDINFPGQPDPDYEGMIALLSDYGFEGFQEEEGRILAYIPADSFIEQAFKGYLESHRLYDRIQNLEIRKLPDRNWNEIWERDYPPVWVTPDCLVRAPFHPAPTQVKHDIVIAPKMSFGTAHHETTLGMLRMMLTLDLHGKEVLDLGCGTGILAILAEKMGAGDIIAVDNDPRAYRNALENVELNACSRIRVMQTELTFMSNRSFDVLLANINLNSLLALMDEFPGRLRSGGILMGSGFFSEDLHRINRAADRIGLEFVAKEVMNNWAVAVYRKAL